MFRNAGTSATETVPKLHTAISERIVNSEAMLLSFIAEKSLPFSLAPDLVNLVKALSADKKALNHLTMHRTTASYKITNGVAKTFHDALIKDLKNTFFSLNIDESTSMNHKRIVSVLVNFCTEDKKIVTKHLSSFEVTTVHSNVLFEELQKMFSENELPWENLISVLLDSCNVMRGKKSGLEKRIKTKCPHLIDIDGDSCHHAHNACKEFCKPFEMHLENLCTDIHNDLKYSPDLSAALMLICEALNLKYTMPQNFISFRWLSAHDCVSDLHRLHDALLVFYFSFCKDKEIIFLHMLVKVYKNHNIDEKVKDNIRGIQQKLAEKKMTSAGRDRKDRIIKKLFDGSLFTKLTIGVYLSILPLLKEYIKIFESSAPLIHKLNDKQVELLKSFLSLFIRPEVLKNESKSPKKLKNLDVEMSANQLPLNSIFIGEICRKLVVNSQKSQADVISKFKMCTLKAFINCAKSLQRNMPIENEFLRAISSIDPLCRQHALSLKFMKSLPSFITNVIREDEIEAYSIEVHKYHSDSFSELSVSDLIDKWWRDVYYTFKYPLLCKLVFAALTCFHGPKVEGSFSLMKNIITPGTSSLNLSSFSSIQTVKYELFAQQKSSIEFFTRKDILHDPVAPELYKNMRSAAKNYKIKNMKIQEAKEEKRKLFNIQKEKALTKKIAIKKVNDAVKRQRLKFIASKHNKGKKNTQKNIEANQQKNKAIVKSPESKEGNSIEQIQLPESSQKRSLNEKRSSEETEKKRAKFEDKESCKKEKLIQKTKSVKKFKYISIKDMFANQKQKL